MITAFRSGSWSDLEANYTLFGLIIENFTRNTAEGDIECMIVQPPDLIDTFLKGFEESHAGQKLRLYVGRFEYFVFDPIKAVIIIFLGLYFLFSSRLKN